MCAGATGDGIHQDLQEHRVLSGVSAWMGRLELLSPVLFYREHQDLWMSLSTAQVNSDNIREGPRAGSSNIPSRQCGRAQSAGGEWELALSTAARLKSERDGEEVTEATRSSSVISFPIKLCLLLSALLCDGQLRWSHVFLVAPHLHAYQTQLSSRKFIRGNILIFP